MFAQNTDVFCKNIYICNNTLKVSKYCDFFLNKKKMLVQILLNASRIGFQRDIRFMEKMITHLDKFSYFPKHYNFHEIMLNSQYPSENFQVEICVLSNNLKIF